MRKPRRRAARESKGLDLSGTERSRFSAPVKVLVVLGPTASGKSALAVWLARALNGAVVSADSRQVYRGLDIGTAKITKRAMRGVPHFLLDVADPKRPYTACRYARDAARAIRNIEAAGKVPIVCGGTGFYIDALLSGAHFPRVPPDPAFRKKMEQRTTEALFQELTEADPERARTIDAKNRRRLIRALEIIAATGGPIQPLKRTPPFQALKLGIVLPKTALVARIRARLRRELCRGLIQEVRRLHREGLSWRRLHELGLEYRFVARYLRGEIETRHELEEALGRAIVQYAKRQMTWFKRDSGIHWVSSPREALAIARRFLAAVQ